MELLTAEEKRNRLVYRWVLVVGIILVMAIGFWLAIPPRNVDLRFLSGLHPVESTNDSESAYRTTYFEQAPSEVEKLMDQHLNSQSRWSKRSGFGASGMVTYSTPGASMPTITVMPNGKKGTIVNIVDPRGLVLFPK